MAKINPSVLDDFIVTTSNHPDYDDNRLMELFPEFNNDKSLLDAAFSYKATKAEKGYDEKTLHSKFPEFFGVAPTDSRETTERQPAQQQSPDRVTNAFAGMSDPLYSGQYQYHQQVADKEAQMQREQAAQLPLSQQDIDRQAEIDRLRQEQFQANFERAQRGEGFSLFPTDNQAAIDALERQKPDYLRGKAKTPQEVYDQTMGAWTANTPEGQKAKAQADRDTEAVLGNIKQQFDADVDSYAAGLQKQFEAEPQVKTVAERMNQQFISTEFKQLQDRVNRGELSVADAQAQADAVWKEKYAPQIQSSAEALWKEKYVPQIQSYADKLWNDTYQEMYSNEASIIQNSLFRQMTDANGDYISQQLRRLGQEEVDRSTRRLSTTIAKDIAQLEKERSEAISRASARGQSRFGAYGAIGGQMSANTAYPREKAERLALLQQAQQFLDDARKMSTGAKLSGQGFWRDLGKGFRANIGDVDTWDMGMSQLVRSANLKKIVEKYEKDKDSLTDEEKALMDAAVTYMASSAYNSDKLSRGYKAGQTTAESIPFMLQFLIMPVNAMKDKVAKGILGYGIDQFGGKAAQAAGRKYGLGTALKETGTLLAGNMAAAGMQTGAFGGAKIAEGTISRMTGQIKPDFDEQGHLVYGGRENVQNLGNAVWNATVDTYVENLSEMILTSGDPIKALVRGSEWFGKTIGKSQIARFIADVRKTPFAQVAERMQFRNYPEEVAEEYVGGLLKWGASTDIHSAKEAGLDVDSQIDIWLGLAPTSIAFAGLGVGGYAVQGGINRWQNSQAAANLRKIMEEGEERKYLESLLTSQNSEAFAKASHDVVKSILRNDKIDDETKRDILDGIYTAYQSQVAQEAEQVQQAEEQQEAQQPQDRQTQLRQQAAQQAQQEVQGMTHQDGNVYYVGIKGKDDAEGYAVSGALGMVTDKDGMYSTSGRDLVTVKMNDGSVQQVPADELVVRDIPVSADELMQERTDHYFAQYANNDLFHVGDKVYLKQNGQQSAESSTIVGINDEGIEVEIIDPNGQPNTTIIPHEQAAEALAVAEGETEDNIVTYVLPDNTQLRLRKTGDGVYEDITPDGTGTIHTEDDLANMGAKPLVQEEAPANTGDNGMQTPVFTIPQEDGVTYSQPVKIWQTKKGRVLADIKKTYTDKDGNKVTEVVTINPDGSTVISNATIPLEGYSLTGGSIETFDGFEIIGFKKLIELPSRQRVVDARDVNDTPIYREQDAIADVIVKGEDGIPFSARVPLIKSEQAPASPAYPTDETGNPDWGQMEVPQSAQVLYDLYKGNRESAKAYADDQLKEAEKVQKAAAKQASHNLNLAQRLKEEENNAKNKAIADAEVKYWEDVKLAIAQIKTAEELAAEQAQREKDAAKAAARRQTEEGLAGGQPAERWNNAPKIEGNAVTRTLPDGTKIVGHYVLAEAGAATPSHNPFNNWNTSEGFPVTEDGRNINDRDYKNDKDAQQITMQIAQTYDGQAVQQVPVVSSEGIVYDGNGRTIAGNIAAANNTDAAYLQALTENAANFGFTPEQVASMQHPRVYLQTDEDMPYNTTTFAKFNAQEKKTMDSVHRAISNAKKLTDAARDGLLRVINSYSSLDAFFASENGAKDILNLLQANNIITEQEAPEWRDKTENGFVLSADGRSGITDLLIGALFDEQTIRMLGNDKGLKQSILRAMPSIIENRQLGDYALTDDINEAIRLLYEARQADMVYKLFVRQGNLIDGYVKDRFSAFSMLLAEEMSSGVDKFRQALDVYNDSARDDANGQATMFEQRTPEDIKHEILKRYEQEQQPAEPAAEQPANEETQSPVSSTPASDEPAAEVTATPAEDNAHLSDNESAFVAPQMPIDTQTNAQKQSKAPSEESAENPTAFESFIAEFEQEHGKSGADQVRNMVESNPELDYIYVGIDNDGRFSQVVKSRIEAINIRGAVNFIGIPLEGWRKKSQQAEAQNANITPLEAAQKRKAERKPKKTEAHQSSDASASTATSERINNETEAQQPADPPQAAPQNTIFTEEEAERVRARMRARRNRLNMGIDPEQFADGVFMAGYYMEKGVRKFADFARAMLNEFGEWVRPYLKQWYMGLRYDPRAVGADFVKDMDDIATVDTFDIDNFDKNAENEQNDENNSENILINQNNLVTLHRERKIQEYRPKELSKEDAELWDWLEENVDRIVDDYKEAKGNTLDPDVIREAFREKGYDGSNVQQYRLLEGALVEILYDEMLTEALAQGRTKLVFLTGHGGAGKSSATKQREGDTQNEFKKQLQSLKDEAGVLFDAAMNAFDKLSKRLDYAIEKGFNPEDITIIPVYNDAATSFGNTLKRAVEEPEGRVLSIKYFLAGFGKNAGKIAKIIDQYPQITIIPVNNEGNNGGRIETPEQATQWNYEITDNDKQEIRKKYEDYVKQGVLTERQIATIQDGLSDLEGAGGRVLPTDQRRGEGNTLSPSEDSLRTSEGDGRTERPESGQDGSVRGSLNTQAYEKGQKVKYKNKVDGKLYDATIDSVNADGTYNLLAPNPVFGDVFMGNISEDRISPIEEKPKEPSWGDTPMGKQFKAIKEQYPDAMLIFRVGDFYELYDTDAEQGSKILGITLTKTSRMGGVRMAGFPFHALDTYLPKLVRAGWRVAICDQLEDPKLTTKTVKRGVTELVETPKVESTEVAEPESVTDNQAPTIPEPNVVTDTVGEITESTHTKTGAPIWVVKPLERVSDAEFRVLRRRAKENNGYYSTFVKGYVFNSVNDATRFNNISDEQTTTEQTSADSEAAIRAGEAARGETASVGRDRGDQSRAEGEQRTEVSPASVGAVGTVTPQEQPVLSQAEADAAVTERQEAISKIDAATEQIEDQLDKLETSEETTEEQPAQPTVLEQAKQRRAASRKKKSYDQQQLDLFAEEDSNPPIDEQTEPIINNEDNGSTEVRNDGERKGSAPQRRTAGQPADQNGTLGGSQRQANEGTQSGGVGSRSEQHRVHDGERGLGTAGQRTTEPVERKQSLRLRYIDEFGVEHILDANYYTLGDVYHINDRLNGDQYNVKASNVLKNIKKKVWTEIVDTPTQETEAPIELDEVGQKAYEKLLKSYKPGLKSELEKNISDTKALLRGEHLTEELRSKLQGELKAFQELLEKANAKNTHNFRYDPADPAPTSNKARYEANLAAIRLLKQLQDEDRQATPEEQRILAKFTGWGGLGEFFKGEPGTTYWSDHGEKSPYQVIKELLTDEEMQAAQLSRNSAYFTPAAIIDELWNVAKHLGFKGGNILEGSAGIGNILAQMPQSISDRSNLQAVEIDTITAGILAQLYPDAQVHAAGFQEVDIPNNSQDLVITNVPFVTGLRVYDKKEKDLSKRFGNIHDFCIAKNVRKLRQGGLGIFITTSGTLDNSKDLRRWLNNEGETDVIGAFRLNRETFGGTSATSDIIVVRKRVNGQKDPRAIDVLDTDVARVAETEEDGKNVEKKLIYNRYFVEHPESMGGEMGFGFEHGDTRWGGTTSGCYPSPAINQSERLQEWVEAIPTTGEVQTVTVRESNNINPGTYEEYHGDLPYGSLVLNSKDEICRVYNGMVVPMEGITPTKVKGHEKSEVLKDYNALKAAVEELLAEQAKGISDEGLKGLLKKLNRAYDDFVKKYGNLNRNVSLSFLRNDVQWASMAALENVRETIDKSGKKKIEVSKTDVFSKRVVGVQAEPKAENARDGVILSVQQYGNVRPDMIATWLGRPQEDVEKEIIESRLAFRDPQTGNMVVSHEYLSGNVREKLAYAEEHNENGIYDTNIEELRKVIPVDIPAHLIEFNIGSTWIPVELYHQYLKEKFGVENLQLVHVGSAWISNEKSYGRYSLQNEKNRAEGVYSEKLMEQVYGHQLMMAAMNNVPLVVSKVQKNYDGTTETITDKEATAACSDKISQIKDDFVEWARGKMQEDSELAERVQKIYNERFNAIVPMLSVDKAFLSPHLPGQNHKYTLYDHQQQAVVRATTQPVMLAHEVGTGKTITLISAAMEMRRLGTAKKPMIVVQNATTPQFVKEAKDLYPNAKILTVSERDRTKEGRQEFYAKIKYNDWDLIIVPQSVFDMIPDSESRMRDFIQEKIEEKLHAIEAAKEANVDEKVTKRMERELEALQEDLQNANMSGKRSKSKSTEKDAKKEAERIENAKARAEEMLDRRTDEVEDFDDMGIDALLIDEAHNYKHLGFATMMTRGVKGIDPSYSKRAAALYLKCQSVYERCGHRNVVFATGTPISNTAAEIWTFMKYLMPKEVLKDNDIYYFDDFVHNFGKINEQLEFATNGKFKANNRFAQYGNVPELMRIWLTCADCVLTREVGQVNDKVPEMEGGKAQDIFLPQSPSLIDIMASVRAELERYEQMSGKEKKENSHIPLTMYGVAKRAAIDPRLVDANAADEPLSKTNKAVEETLRSLKETKKYNGTVAIFCDSYRNQQTGFNLFEDIKAKLVKGGVPAAKIAIIRSEMTDAAKQKIFDAVREGEIRVIMGSTQTLGTGVNIQTRLHTLIHMDAPDRPMDYTQRNGRIIRQGNMHRQWNIHVRVLRFGVEDSLDVTSYQRLKTKAGFIDSIMNGKSMIDNNLENRVLEDVDEGIFDNPVAMLSGSQYALLKSQAERDLRKWQARKQQHDIDQILIAKKLKDNAQIIEHRRQLIATDEQFLQTLKQTFPTGKVTEYNIDGTICHNAAELKEALKAINAEIQARADKLRKEGYEGSKQNIAVSLQFNGMPFNVNIVLTYNSRWESGQRAITINKEVQYTTPTSDHWLGSPTKVLDKLVEHIEQDYLSGTQATGEINYSRSYIERLQQENELMRQREGKPFEHSAELEKAQALVDEYTKKMQDELAEKEAKYANMSSGRAVTLNEQTDEDETTPEAQITNLDYPQFANQTEAQQLATAALVEVLNDNTDLDVFLATDEQMPEDDSEKETRRDREGFVIGDGTWHMPYEVRQFPDYPQIEARVSKASTTESVYVTYTNKNNGASVKVRFSGHISNNERWGVDLPGFAAENGQILERLGLATREWQGNSYIPVRSISKAELAAGNYEVADKTRAELSQLPIGTDISEYKGKLVPDMANNAIYTSDKVVEDHYNGRRIYRDANGNIIPSGRTREAMLTPDGTLYGWAIGDRIYLTKDGLNPNTPIHEYTHLWAKAMRRNNREGWQSIVNIFKDTPMWEEVKNDPNYQGLTTDDAVCSEVLARYSDTRGAVRMEEAAAEILDEAQQSGSVLGLAKARQLISRVRKALSDFWHWVGVDLFGIKHFDSAEQVADRVLWDMLNGTELDVTADREMQHIKERAIADGTFMKAPNGQPTNLNERQWLQVRTRAFKRWFGDWENDPQNASKFLDNNGEPLVAYHGTNADFSIFRSDVGHTHDRGFYGKGFYFTFVNGDYFAPSMAKNEAMFYGDRVVDVYINTRTPFYFDDLTKLNGEQIGGMYTEPLIFLYNIAKRFPHLEGKIEMPNGLSFDEYVNEVEKDVELLTENDIYSDKPVKGYYLAPYEDRNGKIGYELEYYTGEIDTYSDGDVWHSRDLIARLGSNDKTAIKLAILEREFSAAYYPEGYMTRHPEITEAIKDAGYDAIMQTPYGDEIVVFDSNQIKSATDNNGEFSEDNDNIEMMISGYTQEKQRTINEWYAAHPRPQYQVGETLDHYRQRLEAYQEEEKRFREQLQAHRPSNASASTEQSERISQNQAPAFVPGVRPTPMANETPSEYALRLRQYYQLMRDERLVAEYVAEINNQADAAAKVLKKNTIVRGLLDAAKPIENFQEWMKQRGATITDESNAYTDTFLATGRVTEANEQMQRDIIRPLAKQIAKIIAPDAKTGKSRLDGINIVWHNMDVAGTGSKLDGKALTPREIIGVYCQAKDCAEAIEKGLPDRGAKGFLNNLGMSHDDIIAAVESVIPRAELDELWRLINAATHFALNYDYESGRISEDTHTEFYQREFYVPQRGWRERDESGLITEYEPVGKRGNDPYNAALVKAHGRQSLASDPFAYIMSIDASSIVSSENNKIKQKFLQFCLDNEDLGLQTGAFRVKKYWIMNVIDPETGKIKLDEEGNPIMEVSYVAPSAEDLSHDRTIKELIKKKRKEWAKVNQAYLERQSHGELGPQLEAAYKTKLSKIEQAIEDLEQQMHIAWHATNTNITQRTSDEKRQHEVRVLLDGQEYLIEVQDEKLANAINKKFKQHQEQLFNTSQKMRNATRFMSAVLTQYNPEFAASNFARDFQVALATLTAEHPELVGSFLKNFAACQPAVWQYAFNDKVRDRAVFRDSELGRYLQEYFKAGAATGFSYMQDLKSLRQDFDAMVNESNLRRGIKGAVGTLSMLTQVSETAVRFAGYVSARQKGMGINEAAYLSKELTTNFDRAGEVADSGWMSWFSFFRATLNGNIKFLKALKKMPLAYSIIAAAYVAMGMLNQFLNPDDPEDEVWAGDFTRESNFVIGKWRIPTAHFLRMFFAAGVNAAKWMQGEKSFGEATYNTATFASNELLPDYLNLLGNATEWNSREGRVDFTWEGLVQGVMPSPVSPIADVYFNRDFRGATINREPFAKSQEGTKDILLSKENTLPVYKWLTQAIYEGVGGNMNAKYQSDDPAWRSWLFDTSASSVEHVVEGYMPAGMDMFITLGEAIYDAATGTPTGPDKWPFVRKFYNAYTPERAYMQQYYLLNGRVKEFKRNMDDYRKNDRTKYNILTHSQEYRNYQEAERLVKKQKENPTTADVQALINANKQWIK